VLGVAVKGVMAAFTCYYRDEKFGEVSLSIGVKGSLLVRDELGVGVLDLDIDILDMVKPS
jgi:hypothetical protein